MSDNPGFDFITLTKAQWTHLKLIERDHGIPWYIYIRDLIKADMEGRLLHPAARERRKKLRPDKEVKRLEVLVDKIERLLMNPREMIKSWVPTPPASGDFSGIIEGKSASLVKPSDLATEPFAPVDPNRAFSFESDEKKDPNILADGTHVSQISSGLMDELRDKLGLPPLERKKKAPIQFPSHVQVVDAPPPPPVEVKNE